ncbi:Flp family type IVb pilin [Terricaulis silvestris]|uniref:Flp pilus assembly protein, pilin Flp n=1 Tax=Terricaulis silvestris TaxID=2686094 RepID=A0A6I6MW16_9CAUL|nr:Flp family type IVb pilin [Terricaulis silvestris]QGZ96594.1 Flp pilus assembly protein, pilin Flp [Terricaulis silvestris]
MNKLIVKAQVALNSFKRNESGATLVEYSLLIGLITVLVVAAVFGIGGWAQTQWTSLCTAVGATC